MIYKQFLSRDGNATILPLLHCHRQKSIARVSVALVQVPSPQNRDYTEARLLGFSNDFGVTIIHHQNADAMVLANALVRGIHHPDNIENGARPGGCLS